MELGEMKLPPWKSDWECHSWRWRSLRGRWEPLWTCCTRCPSSEGWRSGLGLWWELHCLTFQRGQKRSVKIPQFEVPLLIPVQFAVCPHLCFTWSAMWDWLAWRQEMLVREVLSVLSVLPSRCQSYSYRNMSDSRRSGRSSHYTEILFILYTIYYIQYTSKKTSPWWVLMMMSGP